MILVEDHATRIPFVSRADGDGVRKAAIYVRSGTASHEASYEQLQQLINRRIETGHSSMVSLSIGEHLDQLEKLYERIPLMMDPDEIAAMMNYPAHPDRPPESFEQYVVTLIERKKEVIDALSEKI